MRVVEGCSLGCVTQPTDTERARTFTWSDPLATAAAAASLRWPGGDPEDRLGRAPAAADRRAARLRDHAGGGGACDLRRHARGVDVQPDRVRARRHRRDAAGLLARVCDPHDARRRRVGYTTSDLQVRYVRAMSASTRAGCWRRARWCTAGASSRPPRGGCMPRTAGSCSPTARPPAYLGRLADGVIGYREDKAHRRDPSDRVVSALPTGALLHSPWSHGSRGGPCCTGATAAPCA